MADIHKRGKKLRPSVPPASPAPPSVRVQRRKPRFATPGSSHDKPVTKTMAAGERRSVFANRRHVALSVAVGMGVLFLIGVVASRYLMKRTSTAAFGRSTEEAKSIRQEMPAPSDEPTKTTSAATVVAPAAPPPAPEVTLIQAIAAPAEPMPPAEPVRQAEPMRPPPAPMPLPKKHELTEHEKKVNRAIDAGVEHLKQFVDAHPNYFAPRSKEPWPAGVAAMIGWTLLECGVPADEKHVVKLAAAVRAHKATLDHTYSLSLAIFFLERLGDPKDRALIGTYALRLMAGQTPNGAWSYTCPILTATEERKLSAFLRANAYLTPGSPPSRPQGLENLSGRLKGVSVAAWLRGQKPMLGRKFPFDNSNVQFAVLGLWVAKRQGVPTQPSLSFAARYFRQDQCDDGGWSYIHAEQGRNKATTTMTCAGLLGLAVERGLMVQLADQKNQPAEADPNTTRGLRLLDEHVKATMNAPEAAWFPNYYYLYWSIARTAMIYDLDTVGGAEWYPWLSKLLVEKQKPDGGWSNQPAKAVANDCFALLVLRRVNLVKDLTEGLRSPGLNAEPNGRR